MHTQWEDVWSFSTARFTVTLAVAPEEDDPAGHFENRDDVEFAREGDWHWFMARVRVTFGDDDVVLAEDYLGGCSYHSLADFMAPGDYFRDMVRQAIREARRTVAVRFHEYVDLARTLRNGGQFPSVIKES